MTHSPLMLQRNESACVRSNWEAICIIARLREDLSVTFMEKLSAVWALKHQVSRFGIEKTVQSCSSNKYIYIYMYMYLYIYILIYLFIRETELVSTWLAEPHLRNRVANIKENSSRRVSSISILNSQILTLWAHQQLSQWAPTRQSVPWFQGSPSPAGRRYSKEKHRNPVGSCWPHKVYCLFEVPIPWSPNTHLGWTHPKMLGSAKGEGFQISQVAWSFEPSLIPWP